MPEVTMRFTSRRELRMLPAPENKFYEWYKHASQPGFYCRVSRADAQGNIERIYFHRYTFTDETGKKQEKREPLGNAADIRLEDALHKLLDQRKALKQEKEDGVSTRLTVAGAWAFYSTEKSKHKDATKEKDQGQYDRYLSHLAARYLDDLPYAFWSEFVKQLREGTLVVGQKEREDAGGKEPVLRGPLSDATLIGVLNTAAVLYEIANKHFGIHDEKLKGKNPPLEAKKLLGAPNEKTSHIFLRDLGRAWRAADQLIAPWWRDLFRVFVLTGLRRSLAFGMRFDEIDFERGLYIVSPLKRGTKRRSRKVTSATPDIRIPLSRYVLNIIKARREFAPDQNGLVWHTPKPSRGRRVKENKQALSDPRQAWTLLEWAIGGYHFAPHDLRRTFASAGAASGADMLGVSMLMLHSGEELAKAAQVPGITIRYVDTDEAVERARKATEHITEFVLSLAAMPGEDVQRIVEPPLPIHIEADLQESA